MDSERKPKYRIVRTEEFVFRYAAQQSYGGRYSHMEFAVTMWGARRAIKRAKRKQVETVVYESD